MGQALTQEESWHRNESAGMMTKATFTGLKGGHLPQGYHLEDPTKEAAPAKAEESTEPDNGDDNGGEPVAA